MKQTNWAGFACISIACSQASAVAPDPADATTATPPMIYRSPFADYRALGEDKNTSWKDANDTVGKIGGWRAYAREAAEAMKARGAVDASKTDAVKPAPVTDALPKSAPPVPVQPPHKHGG